LDDGVTWQAVTPHVGDRVIRVTGLASGRTYPIRLRSVRADGTRSEATGAFVITPMVKVPAPDLTVSVDAGSVTVDASGSAVTITFELVLTNGGSGSLHDAWLNLPIVPNATVVDVQPVTGTGAWHALDAWWYGESVEIPAGGTHRVRVTLEAQP
jgi:hypothetical protein